MLESLRIFEPFLGLMDAIYIKVWYAEFMRKIYFKLVNCILTCSLVLGGLLANDGLMMVTKATTIEEVQQQIENTKSEIAGLNDKIDSLSDEQDLIYEKMDDLNSEIINTMTEISLKEEQIVQKEADIAQMQAEYEAAVEKQAEQESSMALNIRLMYEKGNASILQMILESKSFGEMLNKLAFAQSVYEYDMQRLNDYKDHKQYVHDVWDRLEVEKSSLEADKLVLEEQKAYCDGLMANLKKEASNYDTLIKQAKKAAKDQEKLLKKEQEQLKKLQDEEKRKQQLNNMLNQNFATTSYTEIVDKAGGSDTGKKIAKYGLQFVGNPYVYGGTSLTKGADCSGFTYRIYADFGYNIPRTSFQQRSAGTGVKYENAQPGDLICYDGHVGLYIGGGYIVHASSAKTGIKVSKATYRPILAVRRILK